MAFTEEEIEEFKTEASDLLDLAERSLLLLDKGGDFKTQYDSIFRAFHSIKGAAGMMEMHRLQEHMHRLETILTDKKGHKILDKPCIDFFLKGTDAARGYLEGKEVSFTYDLESKDVFESAAIVHKVQSSSPGKIIIIDDEYESVALLRDVLIETGIEVIGTTQPDEVMGLIEKFQPDAVVSDILMPKLDGMALLTSVAKKFPDLPVIFISAHVSKGALMEAIGNGVYAVIEKPFSVSHLMGTCLSAVKKHQLTKLLNSSINLIMYQFSDLDDFLKNQGKEDVRKVIEGEINSIIEQRRLIRGVIKKKNEL